MCSSKFKLSSKLISIFRFSNNGLTYSQIMQLIQIVSADNCPIQNLFIDWNPIFADPFKAGPVAEGTNKLWRPADET